MVRAGFLPCLPNWSSKQGRELQWARTKWTHQRSQQKRQQHRNKCEPRKITSYFPSYWLFIRDPYNGFLYSPYSWVGNFTPKINLKKTTRVGLNFQDTHVKKDPLPTLKARQVIFSSWPTFGVVIFATLSRVKLSDLQLNIGQEKVTAGRITWSV